MNLRERLESGQLYVESGHTHLEDQLEAKSMMARQAHCRQVLAQYNATTFYEKEKRHGLLAGLLGACPENIWIEPPVHMAYGDRVHIGNHFYSNFNLTLVDDGDIYIGEHALFAPNVTISTTGHPVDPDLRRTFAQFSLPVHIGDNVWLGVGVIVLPGVTIGDNSVIGAGSVVTRDIPANVVAFGSPCRVAREITERDRSYYFRDCALDSEFFEDHKLDGVFPV